jgi:hypothetical protein
MLVKTKLSGGTSEKPPCPCGRPMNNAPGITIYIDRHRYICYICHNFYALKNYARNTYSRRLWTMKKFFLAMMSLAIMAGLSATVYAEGQFDHVINAADVEKITGLKGVKQVPREKLNKFRNGDLNFVMSNDKPLLMIQFRPSYVFAAMKADSGYVKTSVPGVGEEAFSSPAFDPQFSINFLKGNYFAIVTTHVDEKDKTKTILKMDQLIAIAKLVATKM